LQSESVSSAMIALLTDSDCKRQCY